MTSTERLRADRLDELGNPVTDARIDALLQHVMFRSDTEAWEVGLVLKSLRADLAAARAAQQAAETQLGYAEANETMHYEHVLALEKIITDSGDAALIAQAAALYDPDRPAAVTPASEQDDPLPPLPVAFTVPVKYGGIVELTPQIALDDSEQPASEPRRRLSPPVLTMCMDCDEPVVMCGHVALPIHAERMSGQEGS